MMEIQKQVEYELLKGIRLETILAFLKERYEIKVMTEWVEELCRHKWVKEEIQRLTNSVRE